MVQSMVVNETDLPGVLQITPFYAVDNRGYFTKDYSIDNFENMGVHYPIREIFYSSSKQGVIRGLHFQYERMQPKMVRCIMGHIYDVVVDLRFDSPTFMKWKSFDLYGQGGISILIPNGFAHGFLALEDSVVSYKCGECFYPEGDSGIHWDDPDLKIHWPLDEIPTAPILSEKDSNLQSFEDFMANYDRFRHY